MKVEVTNRGGMDSLNYFYEANSNKLRQVTDSVADGNYTEDIDNQTETQNYVYDEIGNLIQDKKERLDSIKWSVYGKITDIYKKDGTHIQYSYDAAGNRISKLTPTKKTFYSRDASGNVMSVYTEDATVNSGAMTQAEIDLYGSSRLGVNNVNVDMTAAPPTNGKMYFERGDKTFELSNHLGNVLGVVSDRKLQAEGMSGGSGTGLVSYYNADVVNAGDYYAFGMGMVGRKYSVSSDYRFGFNGKEKDPTITSDDYDFGARVYDGRLGKWLSEDPLFSSYPGHSSYNFAMNNPILFIDPDGERVKIKDVPSLKAILGGLTNKEIKRIKIHKNGEIKIRGSREGSRNLENLRVLVDSKVTHNFLTSATYESGAGSTETLPSGVAGRTLFPASEATGLPPTHQSPDADVYVIIKPTTEAGAVEVAAHEGYGHSVLGEKKRLGEAVDPFHDYGPVTKPNPSYDPTDPSTGGPTITVTEERNNDFKTQSWPATGEGRTNYAKNSTDKQWQRRLERKVKKLERKLK